MLDTNVSRKLDALLRRNNEYSILAERLRRIADLFVPIGCEVGPVVALGKDESGILDLIERDFDRFENELVRLATEILVGDK